MKKITTIILVIILSILLVFAFLIDNKPQEIIKKVKKEIEKEEVIDYSKEINDLRKKYNNQDIIAYLEIPNYLKEPVVQTTDNNYYLKHDIYKMPNRIGATFLDYRINLNSTNKILIYGHSDPEGTLPFVKLTNYNNQDFYNDNKYIYLVDSTSKRKFEVFSSYIEISDFDYVNLEDFNGLTYKQHLEKLKSKSIINTNIELDDNSKVLILQTCNFNETINSDKKYQLVISKELN